MTTERTHLSIGEVLSLLQPEFPDITISKIRFLESQGLLDPERTPSGYRKFHDDDIERLRWILTQQRDHFLPLKVIKDRLASGDLGGGTPEGVLPLAAETADAVKEPTTVPAWASTTPASANQDTPAPAPAAPTPTPSAPEATSPLKSSSKTSSTSSAKAADNGTDVAEPAAVAGNGASSSPAPAAPGAPAAAEHDRAEAVGRLVEAPETPEPETVEDTPPEAGADAETRRPAGAKGRRRHPTGHQPGAPTPGPGAEAEPDATVVMLTIDDLTERSGLSAREIGELERYGLIAGETDGQVTTYDEESLVVARLAAGFNRYGIEPRHLRMYKVAAEREAGLFEQLISPLLKQRRPSARLQAVEMLEDLAELADDLRAAMVRTALREYLGGA
jgi:DNA-binding transcriptional MerR regulator